MKVFLAFCFFFGSIFFVAALVPLCFLLAPAEYILYKRVAEVSAGTVRIPERIFPDLPVKSRYGYPGIQAALLAKDANTISYVMVLLDVEQAKTILKDYAEQNLKAIPQCFVF
jgi:hypothetical protein